MPRATRRKSTPSSPAKSRESTTEPQKTRSTARTRSHEPSATAPARGRNAKRRLAPVDEESETVVLRDPETVQRDTSSQDNNAQGEDHTRLRSSRRVPSIRASVHDGVAPTELRVESMVKHLRELELCADEVLSQLETYTSQQLLDNLEDRQSVIWDDFFENAQRLEGERQHYGVSADFLEIDWLLQELAARNLPTSGAEHIYTKVNLALFLYRLLEAHPVELHNLFVTMASIMTFPQILMGTDVTESQVSTVYEEDFKRQTISIGIGILTQCFLSRARRNADNTNFDQNEVLREVFFAEGGLGRDVSLGFSSSSEHHRYMRLMKETVSAIEDAAWAGQGQPVNLAALETAFPWTTFIAQALAWIGMRNEQINTAIRQEGGVKAIKRGLQQSNVAVNAKTNKGKSRPSRADEDFAGKISFLRDIDENLNAGEAESQAPEEQVEDEDEHIVGAENVVAQEAVEPTSSTRILREIIATPSEIQEQSQHIIQNQRRDQEQEENQDQSNLVDESEPVEQASPRAMPSPSTFSTIRPTQETSAVLRVIQKQAKEGNKENSPPAQPTRVLNPKTTTARATSAIPNQSRPNQNGKRQYREEEDSESDEEAFESDQRQNKRPRPHSGKAAASTNGNRPTGSDMFLADSVESNERSQQTSLPPRQRIHDSSHPGPSTQPAPAPPSTRPQIQRSHSANPIDRRSPTNSISNNNSNPPPSTAASYQQVKQHARANTNFAAAIAPPSTFRPPQTRRPWTADEIERLLFLIGKYGCAWSTIKKADERMVDPQLLERSQVQLKDKARNMKVDYLKAEMELPEGLTGVTISKSHKVMLKGMNIAYPGEEFEEE